MDGLKIPLSGKLGFVDFAGLNSLGRNPYPLDGAVFILDANALQVRLKGTFRGAGYVKADSAFFLRQTFTNNTASANGFFSCNCTFSSHDKYLCNLFL